MRYAILGDIHGNLEALEAVCGSLAGEDIDKFFCVGDIVGYGASPADCIYTIKKLEAVTVAGNHDWAAVDLVNADYFNDYARAAILWTKDVIGPGEKEFLRSLKLVYGQDDFSIAHGTLDSPENFDYMLGSYTAARTFSAMDTGVCFVGHSHVAGAYWQVDRGIDYIFEPTIKVSENNKYIINAGSIGQPRDGDPKAAYCIYDTREGIIDIKRVRYDIKKAQDKILKAGLPEILAYRLEKGR